VKNDQLSQFLALLAEDESLAHVIPLTDEEWAEATNLFDRDHAGTYILFLEEVPMSKEALNAFFKKVADDENLQKKLVEFAAQQGFEFSPEELSDSDLDGVAGGLISPITTSTKIEGVTEMKVESVNLTDMKVENTDLTGMKVENIDLTGM